MNFFKKVISKAAPAVILLMAVLTAANAYADYKEGYYDKMDGKKKELLKAAAKECVKNHTRLNYSSLPNQWQYTDVYPELVDGLKRFWDMYSDEVYLIQKGQTGTAAFSANKMQREHSVPKSWWKYAGDVEYTDAYTDIWNLYPSDGPANQAKLNYPFGPVQGTPSFDNGVSKIGGVKTGFGGGSGKVFEPADQYKGDFARAIFYMATVYDDIHWVINYMFEQEEWPTLRPWAYEMLLQWARQDPVSQKEIDRNNSTELYQRNRNPFVDFPELAEYIWGTRTTETFYIKEQGGAVTPPITGDPELTAPINGEALDFGQVAVGATGVAYLEIQGSNFTSPLSVSVSGTARAMFTPEATTISASAINTSSSYLFPIVFKPTATGVQEAKLTLYDGGLEGSVAVTLRGEGCDVPTLSTPVALDATDIKAYSYVANWKAVPEVVDYYVVTRVRYEEDGAETDSYETQETSLLIENRNPAVMESYTVQASRLGILSESSNSILVMASGVESVESATPMVIGMVEGGFYVISNPDNAPLSIYDASGRALQINRQVAAGETVTLGAGVYVVTSPALARPVKVLAD